MTDKPTQERIEELLKTEKSPGNILAWLIDNAIGFMIAGFGILMVAAVTFTFVVHQPGIIKTIILWAGFSGFGVYLVGRICLSIKRRRQSKQPAEEAETQNGDDE